jgi:hypothetical protein
MEVKFSNNDFRARLRQLTKLGLPTIMGTPFVIFMLFDTSGKKFYGRIEDGRFSITNNSVFSSSGHLITGEFNNEAEGTLVSYTVKPILFSYYWIRLIPIIGFVAFNSVLLYYRETIPFSVFLVPNIFIAIMYVLGVISEKRRKLKLEKYFIHEFRLENVNNR